MTDAVLNLGQRLEIEGTYNLRDVGGYPASGGRVVKPGRLYRSDHLGALTDAGREQFRALGVKHVVDLRTEQELAMGKDRIDGLGAELVANPIFSGSALSAQPEGLTLEKLYTEMVESFPVQLVATLHRVADGGSEPVLVHCTAGKDRTGVAVALSLLAVGVDRDVVVHDYSLTQQNLAGAWTDMMVAQIREFFKIEPAENIMQVLAGSPPEALEAVLDHIDANHGGVHAYLAENGFGPEAVGRLRGVLTVEA